MRYFLLLLFFLSLTSCTNSPNISTLPELKTAINNRLDDLEGDFAVSFKSLDDSTQALSINEMERMHAASTMKTPVIIELYKQAEQGKFSLNDSITIQNQFKSIVDGSTFSMSVTEDGEQDLYRKMGQKTTLYALGFDMITRSSNLATNILIDLLDAKKVTQTMRQMGADSIEVLRGVEDIKAFDAGLSNTITAKDLRIIFEQLVKGDVLRDSSRAGIINILKQQKYNDMFPVKLPKGTPIAHKTGWITGVHHDSGIIYLPDGRSFVLVFLSKNAPNREAVLDASADIAKYCYNFLVQQKEYD